MIGYPIIVRMDDICPKMDKMKFDKYFHMLEGLGIKPLLGVIPCCRDKSFTAETDSNFWSYMKELRESGCPIAMHGVHHVYTSSSKGLVCSRPMSEFAGIAVERQIELLSLGRKTMMKNALDTDIFMPPGHSYDINTLKALKKCGFRFLSDGRSFHPYKKEGIMCIPSSSSYRLHFHRGILTVCIHSDTEDEKSFWRTKEFLERNRDRVMRFQDAMNMNTYPYWFSRTEEIINMKIDSTLLLMISKIRKG